LNSYYAGSIKKISETYPPKRVIILQKSRKSKLSKEVEDFCIQSEINLIVPNAKSEEVPSSEGNICISNGRNTYSIKKEETTPGQIVYSICKNGKKVGTAKFIISNKLEKQILELE